MGVAAQKVNQNLPNLGYMNKKNKRPLQDAYSGRMKKLNYAV